MKKFLIPAAAIVAAVLFAISMSTAVAFAQDTTIRVNDIISPWVEMLMSAVSIIVGGVLLYITSWVKAKFGIDIEARHREALQTALTNGAGLVLAKSISATGNITIDLRHPLIKEAVQYVIEAAPDAVRNFGLDPSQIAEKIVAKLGVVSTTETTVKVAT